MKRLILTIILAVGFIHPPNIFAIGLKKVLVLDIINIDKKSSYNYLERSIKNAINKDLKDKFAFKETDREKWLAVAKKNFIFRQDYHTLTAAMNLGLLSKQDIVIAGGFTTEETKKGSVIYTTIRIIDIPKRKVLSQFIIKAKVDGSIFTSIEKIAQRIVEESKSVLPSKEDWVKSGIKEEKPSLPLFDNYIIGARIGGGLYAMGLGDRLEAQLPSITLLLKAQMPFLWKRLSLQIEGTYMTEVPKDEMNPELEGLEASTTNYILNTSFVLNFLLTEKIGIHPKLGGGYIFQNTEVTGILNEKFNNGILFATGGVEVSYFINKKLFAILTLQVYSEFEENNITLLNLLSLGVNYKL